MPLCDPYSGLTEIDTAGLKYMEAGTQPSTMSDAMENTPALLHVRHCPKLRLSRVTETHFVSQIKKRCFTKFTHFRIAIPVTGRGDS
jgi:hypothetical protein